MNLSPKQIAAALGILVGLVLYFLPAPEGAAPGTMRIAGVIVVTVTLWATAIVPEYFTAILFFFLAVTFTDLAPSVVFSGFHSTAVWMIFGGLILGLAVQSTGLGTRIARFLLRRISVSYLGVIVGASIVAAAMTFLIPSNTGRVMILVPVFVALAERLGFAEGSNGRAALVLGVGAGTLYPSFGVLPAAVPNLVMLGAAESVHGIGTTYGRYFLLQFPAIALVGALVLPFVLRWAFPDTPKPGGAAERSGPMNREEQRVLVILAIALVLWITDVFHGISPAWVALGAGIVLLLPGIGVVPPTSVTDRVNLAPWFFIAGVIGLGAAASQSGLGKLVGAELFSLFRLTPGEDFLNLAAVSLIGSAVSLVTTVPGQPAIMTAMADTIAAATGWPLFTAVMAQVVSWPMVPFPYELPPLVIAAQIGGVPIRQVMRVIVVMMVVAWVVMLPLQYLWWQTLGMFG